MLACTGPRFRLSRREKALFAAFSARNPLSKGIFGSLPKSGGTTLITQLSI
jgi:hypothetical protein